MRARLFSGQARVVGWVAPRRLLVHGTPIIPQTHRPRTSRLYSFQPVHSYISLPRKATPMYLSRGENQAFSQCLCRDSHTPARNPGEGTRAIDSSVRFWYNGVGLEHFSRLSLVRWSMLPLSHSCLRLLCCTWFHHQVPNHAFLFSDAFSSIAAVRRDGERLVHLFQGCGCS